jgi:hypothetical protein
VVLYVPLDARDVLDELSMFLAPVAKRFVSA